MGEIENKITSISDLQNTVTTVGAHVDNQQTEVNRISGNCREIETNVCALGHVFDMVKESVDSSKKQMTENRKIIDKCVRQIQSTDHKGVTILLRE